MANPNDSIGSGSPEVASSPAGEQQPQQLNQLNSSVDSGIAVGLDVDSPSLKLQQRLEQCQRILQVLRRDEAAYQLLRDRLSQMQRDPCYRSGSSPSYNLQLHSLTWLRSFTKLIHSSDLP
ncbi:uncharacterized protein Dwil_GK28337 [Drosophila willistoni]|uniref:Uncharacterized protein n=1 Tax=Drosophila willistoni TaxID=7260 RepID=A0A0Q9WNK8_DROWI|nr:uncharacterized protein Dwil_GK28337 [Drosophila willistoni]